MEITSSDIFKESGEECYLIALKGNKKAVIKGMASFGTGGSDDLVVIPSEEAYRKLNGKVYAAVVISKDLEGEASKFPKSTAVFISAAVDLSHALLKQKLQLTII